MSADETPTIEVATLGLYAACDDPDSCGLLRSTLDTAERQRLDIVALEARVRELERELKAARRSAG